MKRLENLLDCLLFVRKTRKLEMSRQGEQFLVKARQLLRLNDEIWADMTGQSLRGRLRVGVPYDLVTPLAPAMKRSPKRIHTWRSRSCVRRRLNWAKR